MVLSIKGFHNTLNDYVDRGQPKQFGQLTINSSKTLGYVHDTELGLYMILYFEFSPESLPLKHFKNLKLQLLVTKML